ncbi:MAG: hypothetical protein NQU46_05760 [Methanolinea sp.]|nr:hypothetical protein [Methanolinea sp.]
MRHRRTPLFCLILVALAAPLPCPADSAVPVPSPLDIGHVTSATAVACEGTVYHSQTLAWDQSSVSLHDPPLEPGGFPIVFFDQDGNPVNGWTADPEFAELLEEPVPPGETRSSTGYFSSLLASRGSSSLTTGTSLGPGGRDGNNLDAVTSVAFVPDNEGGNAIFAESLGLDAVASHTTTAGSLSCPFPADECPFLPPSCEHVQMGSSAILLQGTLTTTAGTRFMAGPGRPGVSMDYGVDSGDVHNTAGTTGSLEASFQAHGQEGRMKNITPVLPEYDPPLPAGYVPLQSSDISYSERTAVSGVIRMFHKEMHYRSQTQV